MSHESCVSELLPTDRHMQCMLHEINVMHAPCNAPCKTERSLHAIYLDNNNAPTNW